MTQHKARRDRGRILTDQGWKKIWNAVKEKFPDGHTFQAISNLTDSAIHPESVYFVSIDTVSNILNRRVGADKVRVESLFRAFGLKLDANDHTSVKAFTSKSNSDLAEGERAIRTPSTKNLNFVGREEAIAHLNARVNQGFKAIVIQAPGGVGKTTLAQEYLYSQGFDLVLELLMAKEKENITPVESVIEEWLKRNFQEEPGREFGVTLGRLKRQLQTRQVGVLIDNLEPALDGQGKFIETHRRYVELLRILVDSSVKSVTLITSREPLAECVGISNYSLPSLNEQAWQDFFSSLDIDIDATTIKEMHKAYAGNALAMTILCDPIQRDGGMVAYWQEHKVEADLLVELAVENLVKEQFNRLEKIYPEAYRLLCRLGCYRYQDVPTFPIEGLLCLLWDVSQPQHRRVIEALRNRSLVECYKGEYWLHPIIRAEAIARLRASEDWKRANQQAAQFWTDSVKTIEIIEHAIRSLEAYYHYLEINDLEQAASVITTQRDNKWEKGEHLGRSFYRLGMLQQMISAIERIINGISSSEILSSLYNILGDLYWLRGYINKAIECHKKSINFVNKCIDINEEVIDKNADLIKVKLRWLSITGIFNIGLCKLDIWEIEESLEYFMQVKEKEIILDQNNNYEIDKYFRYGGLTNIDSWFCIGLLKSLLNFSDEAYKYADYAYNQLTSHYEMYDSWSKGYSLLFLGKTYKNLKEIDKSFEMYNKAITYAQDSNYTQVKAKALTGLAELYREQENFESAFLHHSKSINILKEIDAKCDLAEAYYQLALTYQKLGQYDQSKEYFDKAIQLFKEMEAPKQVEKVRQAISKSDEI